MMKNGDSKVDPAAALPAFFAVVYGLLLLTNLLFLAGVREWTLPVLLVTVPAVIVYPFFEILPAALLTGLTAALTGGRRGGRLLTGLVAFLTVFPMALFLLIDAGLYARYHYHVNMHVWNIFTTPGGFEGMGLRTGDLVLFIGGSMAVGLFYAALTACFLRFKRLSLPGVWGGRPLRFRVWGKYLACVAGFAIVFLIGIMSYAYCHFKMIPAPLLAAERIPFYIRVTAGSFFQSLGMKNPAKETVQLRLRQQSLLKAYPQQAIRRTARPGYNIVWLACESWGAKLFTPAIMPETAAFARKGQYFRYHFSGGNVTRQGVFSMFYGLPGSYWHTFLTAGRGPLLFDWLKEDGYVFDCLTSSKFSYPEFDRTVFAALPPENLHEDFTGRTWERDQRNVERLVNRIAAHADAGERFFAFMFFESPHHPYEFPPEARLFDDCMDPFNALQAKPSDGPAIFRRAANTARHLDQCLARVYRVLEAKDLLKNTIVVLAGDHGEEYFEKGYLGHSSAFNNEQTRTTLILYYPGIKPGVYDGMSSHLDIVPMIAGLLGVQNDPEDYSCGMDLLAPDAMRRRYCIIANWDDVFFAGEKYKTLLPLSAVDYAKQVITDAEDKPLEDTGLFYQEYGKDLIRVQQDLNRFASGR